MKPKLIILMTLALAAAAGAGALAQPAGVAGAPQDGVTLQLFQQRRLAQMMRADTDHDGRISLQEWTASRPQGRGDPERQFARMDANHDRYLTPDEINALLAARFARLDANHDGVLSRDELAAARPGQAGAGPNRTNLGGAD